MTVAPTRSTGPTRSFSTGRRIALVVGGLFAVVLIAGGTWSLINLLGQTTDERQVTLTPESNRLRIATDGDVRITAGTDGDIHVVERLRYGTRRPSVEETNGPDGVTINGHCPWFNSNCSVDVIVTVPAALVVEVDTSAGDITVSGVTGQLTLDSSAGDVRASNLRSAQVEVETSAGSVDLSFDAAPSLVSARSSAGDVTVRVPDVDSGYQVDLDTSAGDPTIQVKHDPNSPRRISVHSSAGDVGVRPRGQ